MNVAIILTLVLAVVVVVTLALCRTAGRADEGLDREGLRWRGVLLRSVGDRRRTERPGSPERRSRPRPWG